MSMQQPTLDPLISGEDIRRTLRKRRSKDVFKTVTASKPALLKEKVKLEEEDGWRVDRKNKRSYRLARPKPAGEQQFEKLKAA